MLSITSVIWIRDCVNWSVHEQQRGQEQESERKHESERSHKIEQELERIKIVISKSDPVSNSTSDLVNTLDENVPSYKCRSSSSKLLWVKPICK
jgi:hypothetical protein